MGEDCWAAVATVTGMLGTIAYWGCSLEGGLVCGTVYGLYRRLAGLASPRGWSPPRMELLRMLLGCCNISSSPNALLELFPFAMFTGSITSFGCAFLHST